VNITIVTSENNPQLKEMTVLLTHKGRKNSEFFLVEGFRVVREAALAGLSFARLAIRDDMIETDRARELLKMPHLKDIQVLKVPRGLLKKLSSMETPQGVVAQVRRPAATPVEAPSQGLSVACEMIQDPRNLGMLLRTAHAAGAKPVFLGEGSVDRLHPTAVSASAGSIFHVPVCPGANMEELVLGAKKNGVEVWATAASGGEELPKAAAETGGKGVMLLFGNEGAGLSPALMKLASRRVSIPMPGGAESLNIAVASAVILFHLSMNSK